MDMFWLWERMSANDFFLFSLAPAIGGVMAKNMREKRKVILLVSLLFFVIISFTGYYFITVGLYKLSMMLIVAVLYAFVNNFAKIKSPIFYGVILSVVLLFLSLARSVAYALGGSEERQVLCREDGYMVELSQFNGFSGRQVPHYHLYSAPASWLLHKKIQTVSIDPFDSMETCIVDFDKAYVKYDKCKNTIVSKP